MSSLNDEDRQNLTAYLDGELDEEATQALEAKLSQDPAARAEVEALKHAWGLLDFLPRAAPSATFTHRTMERLSLERRPAETARMPRAPGWGRSLAWAAAAFLAAALGYWASAAWWRPDASDADEPLLRQLPVIEKWRAYESVDDVDFLKKLDDPDLFGDDLGS
jgi:anti-sigma factor RsiW